MNVSSIKQVFRSAKFRLAFAALAVVVLSGCVYGPGYGYVRGDGYNGDAYYGDSYYDSGSYGYAPYDYGYYGYGPAIGLGFYYGNDHRRHYYRDHDRGHWGGNGGRSQGYYGHGGNYGSRPGSRAEGGGSRVQHSGASSPRGSSSPRSMSSGSRGVRSN